MIFENAHLLMFKILLAAQVFIFLFFMLNCGKPPRNILKRQEFNFKKLFF